MKMKITFLPIALLFCSPILAIATEIKLGEGAAEVVKDEPELGEFADRVISAFVTADVKTLEGLSVIGEQRQSWEAMKLIATRMLASSKVLSATYDVDMGKRSYTVKGSEWNVAAPMAGEMTLVFKIAKKEGMLDDEIKLTLPIARLAKGWRVAVPTTKK